jgi:hypothetical protein
VSDAVLIASMVTWVAARAVAMGGLAERAKKLSSITPSAQ